MIISPEILAEIETHVNGVYTVISANSGATITGTTAQQVLWSTLIPANTLTANSFVFLMGFCSATGTNSTKSVKLYINDTNDLAGSPVLFSIWTGSSTILSIHGERSLLFKADGTFITSTLNGSADIDDVKVNINAFARIPYNVAQNKYLIVAGNLGNASDSLTFEGIEIQIRKS